MNINLQDKNTRENYLKHFKDNKQFNIYPDNFAVKLIEELEGGKSNGN